MQVILAQPRGFCAGVHRAVDIVERAIEKFGAPIYVRHEIVHNKQVVEDLKKRAIYREVPEVLKQVRSKFPIGIISNADTDFLLDSIKNNSLGFDLIMTSEGVKSYKPHPYIFEKALEYFGADPDEVLYIGDSPLEDIIGPQKLGIPSVWVNRKGLDWSLGKENQPYAEITDLLQLLDVINSKQNISY